MYGFRKVAARVRAATLWVAMIVSGCAGQSIHDLNLDPVVISLDALPKLCERIDTPRTTRYYELASPSQFWPTYEAKLEGVTFLIGVDEARGPRRGDRKVHYIATYESQFRTPEGASVGLTPAQLGELTNEQLRCETGWACFVALPSGWSAAFAESYPPTQSPTKVKWFFKRQHGCPAA